MVDAIIEEICTGLYMNWSNKRVRINSDEQKLGHVYETVFDKYKDTFNEIMLRQWTNLSGESIKIVSNNGEAYRKYLGALDRTVVHEYGFLHETVNSLALSPTYKVVLVQRATDKGFCLYPTVFDGHEREYEETLARTAKRMMVQDLGMSRAPSTRFYEVGKTEYTSQMADREPIDWTIRTSLVCGLSELRYKELKRFRSQLNREKEDKTYEDYIENIKEGQIRGIHVIDYKQLLDKDALELTEVFKDGGKTEYVLFDESLLVFLNPARSEVESVITRLGG